MCFYIHNFLCTQDLYMKTLQTALGTPSIMEEEEEDQDDEEKEEEDNNKKESEKK